MVQQKWTVCLKAVGLVSRTYWDSKTEKRCWVTLRAHKNRRDSQMVNWSQ